MALATHLIDTSVFNRIKSPVVEALVVPLMERALAATCGMLNLEALYSAQSPADYVRMNNWRGGTLEYLDTDEADLERAQEVQAELAAQSMHRAASLPDLLIAAVAERHRVSVLHYDQDFDYIAAVTGQATDWVAPKGSL